MKHPWQITTVFIALFIASQLLGLLVLNMGVESFDAETGQVTFSDTAAGERPEISGFFTILYVLVGVGIGTAILLFIAKKGKVFWWKTWFFLAVWISISITLDVLLQNALVAWVGGAGLAYLKLMRNSSWIHNATELLIYPGLAFFLVPLFDITSVFILLVLISIYDAYAVWKSKHMITMAKFTSDSKIFPGFNINYASSTKKPKPKSKTKTSSKPKKSHSGVLGGGDIAIPMLFIGTVFLTLLEAGFTRQVSLTYSSIIIFTSAASLGLLFYFSKEKTFYPAMPFLSAGCFVGYALVLLLI